MYLDNLRKIQFLTSSVNINLQHNIKTSISIIYYINCYDYVT